MMDGAVGGWLRRHANLRSGFEYEGLARPVQIITRRISAPWQVVDLTSFDEAERERRFDDLVRESRWLRLAPDKPPMLRFILIRMDALHSRLVINTHHIQIDGWSLPLIVRELMELYRRERVTTSVDPELSRRLTAEARARNLTLNTVMQGVWAALLSRLTGRDDIVFGITVSGRPPEIAGIETMVGLLINTLPARIKIDPGDSFIDMLTRLQGQQTQLLPYQYMGMTEIQKLTGLNEMFDTLLVFENYPDIKSEGATSAELRVADLHGDDNTHYPLTMLILPAARLSIRTDYRSDCFRRDEVETLVRRFVCLLQAFADDAGQSVAAVDLLSADERRQLLVEWNTTEA